MHRSLSRTAASVMAACLIIPSSARAARVADPTVTSTIASDNYFKERRLTDIGSHSEMYRQHFEQVWRYVFHAINPDTHVASSFPEERRLAYWSVSYDNAIRIMAHVRAGQISEACKAMNYFMTEAAIQDHGWIRNIVDASESREGGRTIEHMSHVGPNVYFGLAAISLYKATGDKTYFKFAKEHWELISAIQNRDPKSPNYGGIPMGPKGTESLSDQKSGFLVDAPSFSEFYNTEHNADFLGYSKAMKQIDPDNAQRYDESVQLVAIWARTVFDKKLRLFHMGTVERDYMDHDLDRHIKAGVMPLHPLDASALMLSALGYDGLDAIGLEKQSGVADRIRQAIEDNFRVQVTYTTPAGEKVNVWGYDFLSHDERKLPVLFEEQGHYGDQKVALGKGREALISDEWSSWVSFADLSLADDLAKKHEFQKADLYYNRYAANALEQGLKTAVSVGSGLKAQPYAHPIPYSYNKPVGFGWNTPHESYALIGTLCRYLGVVGHDPLRAGGSLAVNLRIQNFPLGDRPESKPDELIFTEAEQYINKAWDYANSEKWQQAVATIDRLHNEHPEWERIAVEQERMAAKEPEFPLRYANKIQIEDLTAIYKKYWALYHLGTGEFIRLRGNFQLGREDQAVLAMKHILTQYQHAQAYDPGGWLWQIKDSALNEFNEEYVQAKKLIEAERVAQQSGSNLPLDQ